MPEWNSTSDPFSKKKIHVVKTHVLGSINSHYFHIIGDGKINPIIGFCIPIVRIPIKGGMTIPNIATTLTMAHMVFFLPCCFSECSLRTKWVAWEVGIWSSFFFHQGWPWISLQKPSISAWKRAALLISPAKLCVFFGIPRNTPWAHGAPRDFAKKLLSVLKCKSKPQKFPKALLALDHEVVSIGNQSRRIQWTFFRNGSQAHRQSLAICSSMKSTKLPF